MTEVVVLGVGIHKFGRYDDKSYQDIGREAAVMALQDAGVAWRDVDAAFSASMNLPPTTGPRILGELGLTSIPIFDVECASASGAVPIWLGYQMISTGVKDVVLAMGVEKMPRGFMDPRSIYEDWQIRMGLGVNPMYWALWAQRHMADYGTTEQQIAQVSVKNHKHGASNPYAMYQKETSLEEVMNSRLICDPIRLLELCAPNEGAAAVVLCSAEFAARSSRQTPVTIAGVSLRSPLYPQTRAPSYSITANMKNPWPTTIASQEAYEMAGVGPEDLDVVELQDADAFSEIRYMEELGLCADGEGGPLVESGATEIGGRLPVNPSGGLLSKGEPMGASAVAQIVELTWQLRGEAGARQVEGAKVALAHVIGAGDNCGVTILKR